MNRQKGAEPKGITCWQQYQFGGARNDMSLRFPHAGNQTATDQGAARNRLP
jgi:hypothetical protein